MRLYQLFEAYDWGDSEEGLDFENPFPIIDDEDIWYDIEDVEGIYFDYLRQKFGDKWKGLGGPRQMEELRKLGTKQTVPISKIICTEKWLDKDKIDAIRAGTNTKSSSDMPQLYEINGKYYAGDGNHRIVAAAMNGEKSIQANVFSADADLDESLNEITMDHRTSKRDFDRSDLDEFIDRAYPVGNVKGFKIFLFDEDEPEEVHYLVGDPNSEGFLGYVSLIFGDRDKFYRTNVFFDPEIQGKGLAVPLYAFAIKHSGQTVVSDLTQTKGSKLLWQKLAKTPGINVYGWDADKNEYFHWDPDTDEENEVWQDTKAVADEVAVLRKKMVAIHNDYEDGKMSQQDYEQLTKQYKDEADAIQNQRQNYRSDIRLVATKE